MTKPPPEGARARPQNAQKAVAANAFEHFALFSVSILCNLKDNLFYNLTFVSLLFFFPQTIVGILPFLKDVIF